jgi:hypothetical protein
MHFEIYLLLKNIFIEKIYCKNYKNKYLKSNFKFLIQLEMDFENIYVKYY